MSVSSEPMIFPCPCGATLRVTAAVSSGPTAVDQPNDLVMSTELRIRRRLAHEGGGIMQDCWAAVLELRAQLAKSDLAQLQELAESLQGGHDASERS